MKIAKLLKKDVLIFIIGLALICYPIISNYIESKEQSKQIATYESTLDSLTNQEQETMLNLAKLWNDKLYMNQKGLSKDIDDLKYETVLDVGDGIMGSIEIPKINVNVPIYHGTDDDKLSVGVGHVNDSSLPIGGNNTHAVLTGHRGLPSSKLFTRLDELEKDDLFYLKVFNDTLAYKVAKIEVLAPDKVSYPIYENADEVTLITCTPYGINTHRLVITGIRTDYQPSVKEKIKRNLPSLREIIFYMLPIIFSIIGILVFRKRKEKNNA